MLALHFINVGDGDAILAEHQGAGGTFRLLVDAGRADVGACPGSRRVRLGCAGRRIELAGDCYGAAWSGGSGRRTPRSPAGRTISPGRIDPC